MYELECDFVHGFFFIVDVLTRTLALLHLIYVCKDETNYFISAQDTFLSQDDINFEAAKIVLASGLRAA